MIHHSALCSGISYGFSWKKGMNRWICWMDMSGRWSRRDYFFPTASFLGAAVPRLSIFPIFPLSLSEAFPFHIAVTVSSPRRLPEVIMAISNISGASVFVIVQNIRTNMQIIHPMNPQTLLLLISIFVEHMDFINSVNFIIKFCFFMNFIIYFECRKTHMSLSCGMKRLEINNKIKMMIFLKKSV